MINSYEMTKLAVQALDSKKAREIRVLKIEELSTLADYFVICSATSSTHVKTLADEVDRVLSLHGEPPLRSEGHRDCGWVLVDFSCVVVHIFLDETRKFYSLERLWGDAPEIDADTLLEPKEDGGEIHTKTEKDEA